MPTTKTRWPFFRQSLIPNLTGYDLRISTRLFNSGEGIGFFRGSNGSYSPSWLISEISDFANPSACANRKTKEVATPLGFEPRITPPKGAVLPLHHGVSRFRILDWRFWIKSQSAKSEGATPRPNDDSPIQETSLYFRFDFMKELSVENLHVTIADQEIVRGL